MPQPKSTDLKLLSGTFRKDRQQLVSTPASGLPSCPKELSDDAKKEWKRVARILAEHELLSQLDLAALTSYAVAWARWRKAEQELASEDLVSISGNGTAFQNPLLKIAQAANQQMLRWARELGLSPASRQRLPVVPPRPIGKLGKYLKNGNEGRKRILFDDDKERAKEVRFFGDAG